MAGAFDVLVGLTTKFDAASSMREMNRFATDVSKKLGTSTQQALGKAAKVFTVKEMAKIEGRFNAINKKMTDALHKAHQADLKLQDETISRWEKRKAQADIKAANRVLQAEEKRAKAEAAHVQTMVNRREQAGKALKGEVKEIFTGETAKNFGEGLAGAFTDVLSADVGSIAALIQKAGKGAREKGLGMQQTAGPGGMGQMQAGIGSVLGKFGKMIGIIGGVVAGIAALVKLIFGADEKMKEMNRTIAQSGGAVGDLADQASELRYELKTVRNAALEVKFNMDWGTEAKEQMELMAAWQEAGFTLKEMAQGAYTATQKMQAYQEATKTALIYSKLLGQSTTDIAQQMAGFMEDLGLSLEGIHKRFAAVYQAASESGYGTKRFAGMVLQATSGMSMYNVRLEQSAALMLQLSKILGTKMGGEFFQSMTDALSGESYEDRFKRLMLTGRKKTAQIMSASAKSTAADFADKLAGSFKKGNIASERLKQTFKEFGIGVDWGKMTSPKGEERRGALEDFSQKMLKKLQGLDPKQQERMLTRLRETMPSDLARQFENLIDLGRAAKGDTDSMLKAMSSLDPGASLAMQINSMNRIFGKPLHELNYKQLMAVEKTLGISGKQLAQLIRVSRGIHGSWNRLKDMQKEYQKLKELAEGGDDMAKVRLEDLKEELQANERAMAKTHGMVLKNGEIVSAAIKDDKVVTGQKLGSLEEALVKADSALKEATEQGMDEQTAAARAIARNTTDMSKYLKTGVDYFLKGIFGVVGKILTWITGGLSEDEKRAQQDAIDQQRMNQEELVKMREDLHGQISELRQQADKASGEEKDKLENEIGRLTKQVESVDLSMAATEAEIENLRKVRGGWVFDKETKEFVKEGVAQMVATVKTEITGGPMAGLGLKGMRLSEAQRTIKEGAPIKIVDIDTKPMEQMFVKARGTKGQTQIEEWKKEALQPFQEQYLSQLDRLMQAVKAGGITTTQAQQALDVYYKATLGSKEAKLAQQEAVYKGIASELEKPLAETNKSVLESATGITTALKEGQSISAKQRQDALKEQQVFLENVSNKNQAKANAVANADELERRTAKAMLAQLGIMGGTAEPLIAEMMATGELPEPVKKRMGQREDVTAGLLPYAAAGGLGRFGLSVQRFAQEQGIGGTPAGDFLLRVGRRGMQMQRIDPGDVMMGTKPGGAVAAAGGGRTGGANVFHMYNDGPGILNTVIKAQKAGLLG